ncbi:Zn(2)-C6 fungal-type DNA-binding domain protein [Cordyceps fumosorosea ARSEF 2679]|uniref:Zn(2)-C6 fungal-type DNA-binding domain protein n=1 Tax=Cordyceps fumosorosea (strain ARSEF 2679) TaxID=1081104 RepID=A0A162MR50_CORFA|nr:Zn(2)-C6 fungal-type DNA-binding domain protein [Cordyceps fumosorosea ARSEF 2679]OAA68869.1 Zn(2)-C6 fungal-type DNA-binding domain protein [Cordyceps fumosorosea ARSEF 2679]
MGSKPKVTQSSPPATASRSLLRDEDDYPDEASSSNPLKRPFDDGVVDYPRRRATIACEVCRSRKSRCDGTRPKCKLCTELGANCVYREPVVKLDVGDKMIIDHLNRIEGMLQASISHQQQHYRTSIAANPSQLSPSPSSAAATVTSPNGPFATPNGPGAAVPVILNGGLGTWANAAATSGTNISTMPKCHTNAAFHLLQWPLIRDLVPHQYDPQILVQLEMEREPLDLASKPLPAAVDLSNAPAYVEAYFAKVNVWYACVNPYTWKAHYRAALASEFRTGPESCVVLLVLALGRASLGGPRARRASGEQEPPGLSHFAAAWALLPGMLTASSAVAAQCLLLAAAYLFYLARPLEAWSLLSSAGAKLQLLLMARGQQTELVERIYWNTLLFESDLLAELDLPHSGVAQFEEQVGLPGGFAAVDDGEAEDGDVDASPGAADELWYFLAEIALRRLLNRVSQLLYADGALAETSSSLAPVVAELDYQLTQWYEGLPPALRFSFARARPLRDPVQTVLKLRYHACKVIIYRPYVRRVLRDPRAVSDPVVREGCRKCLDASVRQLEHISEHHAGHMPYTWQGALSMASQSLLLMGATISPSLRDLVLSLVPDEKALDSIIQGVIDELGRYSVLAPSINLAAEIVKEANVRRPLGDTCISKDEEACKSALAGGLAQLACRDIQARRAAGRLPNEVSRTWRILPRMQAASHA